MSRPLQLLNGKEAAAGYRIGSRQRGSNTPNRVNGFKYYIAFEKRRVSPYFQSPVAAAKWLRSTVVQR